MPAPTFLELARSIDRKLQGNIQYPVKNLVFADSPYTILVDDDFLNFSALGGNIITTFPDATLYKGIPFGVKKTDASTNTVTVGTTGGQTIDGAATKVLVNQNDFLVGVSDGANWKLFAVNISAAAASGAVFYQIEKILKTNGISTLVPVDGTLLNFTVAVDGECAFWAAGVWSGNQVFAGGSLNFRIDGVDYAAEAFSLVNGSGGDRTTGWSLSPHVSIFLTAGPHTVELVASQSGIGLIADATNPVTLSVLFPGASASVASPTPKAATLVVDPIPGLGDYTTIQNALTAIGPLGGGLILIREGTYDELLTYPVDIPVVLRGCGQNTILAPTGAGALFKIPDGLTQKRVYLIEDLQIHGAPLVAQTGFQIDDANNFADFELHNVNGDGLQRFAHWTQYDLSFTRQSDIFLYNSVFTAISGGSTLVTTPNAAGSYLAAVAIRASEGSSFTSITAAGVVYAWTANADADLWVYDCTQTLLALAQGITMNGFLVQDSIVYFFGAGSATFNGNGWGAGDFLRNITSLAFDPATFPTTVDFQLIVAAHAVQDSFFYYAVKALYTNAFLYGTQIQDLVGSAHPGLELNGAGSVATACILTGTWPQGAVKLNGAGVTGCKVHHNIFASSLVAATILEAAGADSNVIDGNTGQNNGTGLTIVGPSTTVDGARKSTKSATSTAALVTAVPLMTNPLGLQGVGWVKNTGGANSIDVKESFTDMFGTTSTLTTTVPFGATLPLSLGIAIGTGLPPYVSYKVEVIDTVAASHSTYEVRFTAQGVTL